MCKPMQNFKINTKLYFVFIALVPDFAKFTGGIKISEKREEMP